MPTIPEHDPPAFEKQVTGRFAFLESEYGFEYAWTKAQNDDPRDSCIVGRFQKADCRIDIAWNATAMSLGALIRLNRNGLTGNVRYVYFEPFVEFSTEGAISPVIPQIYPKMSISQIEKVMRRREILFSSDGLENALAELAIRMEKHFATVFAATVDQIQKYHRWYEHR